MTKNILNSKILGKGDDFLILHGLFGMKDNWNKFARDLENRFKFHLIDLRNHGESFHDDIFNYDIMSEDLLNYMDYHNIKKANFMGHSMGGKVLMNFVCKYPEKVNKTIIVDISPKYYSPHHKNIILAMKGLNLDNLTNRKEAEIFIMDKIKNFPTVMFLLKNLKRDDNDRFYWSLNLDIISNNLEEIGKELKKDCFYNGEVLFLKGENSSYIENTDIELIKTHFPRFKFEIIKNSGHIIHLENYDDFYDRVVEFINL